MILNKILEEICRYVEKHGKQYLRWPDMNNVRLCDMKPQRTKDPLLERLSIKPQGNYDHDIMYYYVSSYLVIT